MIAAIIDLDKAFAHEMEKPTHRKGLLLLFLRSPTRDRETNKQPRSKLQGSQSIF
jgi:hypothetical protein